MLFPREEEDTSLRNTSKILVDATKFLVEGSYECSANKFNQCKEIENTHFLLFTYCEAMCFIFSGIIDNIAKSLDILTIIETEENLSQNVVTKALAAYGFAKALYLLKDYKGAKDKCQQGIDILHSTNDTPTYILRSDKIFTQDVLKLLPELFLPNLKNSIKALHNDTKRFRKPLAICRGNDCLDVNAKPYLNSERAIHQTDFIHTLSDIDLI